MYAGRLGWHLDRQKLVDEVYGDDADVYNDVFAPGTLPPDHAYDIPYDPDEAARDPRERPRGHAHDYAPIHVG